MAANSSGRATPSIVASSRTGRCDGTSASKVLDLLEAVAARDRPVGLSEMSIATGIPKSTAHRLLKTLESHHLIGRVGSKYQLGEHLADLGDGARTAAYGRLIDAACEAMGWLFERTGTIVHVGVLKGTDVMLVDKITVLTARGSAPAPVHASQPAPRRSARRCSRSTGRTR